MGRASGLNVAKCSASIRLFCWQVQQYCPSLRFCISLRRLSIYCAQTDDVVVAAAADDDDDDDDDDAQEQQAGPLDECDTAFIAQIVHGVCLRTPHDRQCFSLISLRIFIPLQKY